MVRQKHIAKEDLSHNLDELYLEDTMSMWCLSYPSGGHHLLGAMFLGC